MDRWDQKRKKWHDRQSRLGNKKRKRHQRRLFYENNGRVVRKQSGGKRPTVTLKPPNDFSLTNNPEETMGFFMAFANEINKREHGTQFYIDSKEVESATVDALMYLIAILQNDTVNNYMNYSFAGNYPLNEKASKVYAESGFNDYVFSKMRKLPHSTDKMRIICGKDNSPTAAKELSDFVMTNLCKTRKDIQPIQKVLIELMSNVFHHAYEKNGFMAKKWYMYAEHVDDYIRCVFVDTGFGIAKTARKNFKEKIRLTLGMKVDDAGIIKSIFDGDFRTATNKTYRGNGLSAVRENVNSAIFEKFEVFSGRGRVIIPKSDESRMIISMCYENMLYGTLYQFVIK